MSHSKLKSYLSQSDSRLINALYSTCLEGVYYCLYKEYFDKIESLFKSKPSAFWYIQTVNAYYDLAVINWCKIFGSYTEPTHYSKIFNHDFIKSKLIGINSSLESHKDLKNIYRTV
jgi:hypothetical protein